jgi:hypothetical protein
MPTDSISVWDLPIDVEAEAAFLATIKPKRRSPSKGRVQSTVVDKHELTTKSELQTVQAAYAQRLCRYGLVNLAVTHETHGCCIIASTAFETADATTATLLLWVIADKDDVSCLEDFHLVPASECTLATEWPEACCKVRHRG